AGAPRPDAKPSATSRAEKDLWLAGRFAVAPLHAVLADDALADLHGPASQAFALCAHVTLDPADARRYPERTNRVQARNALLGENVIAFQPDQRGGFVTIDPDAAGKRGRLIALYADAASKAEFAPSSGAAWRAILLETGFCTFMGRLFTGTLVSESRPSEYVFDIIARSWKVTFWLNIIAVILAWGASIPLGIRSARRLGTVEDRVTTNLLFLLWSLPSFFVGALLLHHFCTDHVEGGVLRKAWFPNAGLSSPDSLWYTTPRYLADLAWHGCLPLLVLSYGSFTSLSRYMRGNMLDQLGSDYARTARAKGCSEDRVVYGHVLRNSSLTMITLGAGLLAELFSGVLIVELLFSIPGLGLLLLEAAKEHDSALVMGSTVIQVGLLLVGILIADILYAVVDPRIRSRYA
ncbi:MAG: ABC transporter permease, partial [Planctomycetes bacterium]|nr:ABC transporter permease [Planctomycetota bacterium]